MLRFLKYIIIVPVAIVLLVFFYANKHMAIVSVDPNLGDGSPLSVRAPLFVVIIASVIVGAIAGSVTTWFGQGRHRKLARQLRVERDRLKADFEATKARSTQVAARRA